MRVFLVYKVIKVKKVKEVVLDQKVKKVIVHHKRLQLDLKVIFFKIKFVWCGFLKLFFDQLQVAKVTKVTKE